MASVNILVVTNRGMKEVKFFHEAVDFAISDHVLKIYTWDKQGDGAVTRRELAGYRTWTSYHIVDDPTNVPDKYVTTRQYNLMPGQLSQLAPRVEENKEYDLPGYK